MERFNEIVKEIKEGVEPSTFFDEVFRMTLEEEHSEYYVLLIEIIQSSKDIAALFTISTIDTLFDKVLKLKPSDFNLQIKYAYHLFNYKDEKTKALEIITNLNLVIDDLDLAMKSLNELNDLDNKTELEYAMMDNISRAIEVYDEKLLKKEKKIEAFDYMIYRLVQKQEELTGKPNDICRAKALKLSFYLTARSIELNKENNLLDLFDDYWAMPLGHVEMDIYQYLKAKKFRNVFIDNEHSIVENENFQLDEDIKKLIDETIDDFTTNEKTKHLISYDGYKLCEVNRKLWFSFKVSYQRAREKGLHWEKIDNELIRLETKIYKEMLF